MAVSPKDPKYADLLNRCVLLGHPLREDPIPLIADEDGVDPELGTGAVKITPAHDFNDFEIGRRHNLKSLTVIDDNGKLCFDQNSTEFRLNDLGKEFIVSIQNPLMIEQKQPNSNFSGNAKVSS